MPVTASAKTADSFALPWDVTSAAQINAAVGEIVARCGKLDLVVNNAGVNTLAHRVTITE